jgi:hypothetical protein
MSNNKDDATYHPGRHYSDEEAKNILNRPASAGTHDKGGVYDWQRDPGSGYADPVKVDPSLTTPKPRKKKRVFLWFFLAVQAVFIIWILGGAASAQSNSNCNGLDAQTCSDATAVGTGIGIFMILVLWVMFDFILAVGYGIKYLATRNR